MLPKNIDLKKIRAFCPVAPWVLGAILLALLWMYWPTLFGLFGRWRDDSRYSHGWLVPLFSLYLLYSRRDQLSAVANGSPNWWGMPILLAGLLLSAVGTYLYLDWFNAVALLPCLAGLVVLVGGRPALRWSWPGIAFLGFMVPLPFRLEIALAHPLQRIGTIISTYALQTFGFAAFAEGNVIRMGEVQIGVVEACSGLSMLVIFFALSTAVAIVVNRPMWERILLAVSAIPIALASNVTRITVTGALHKLVGHELADYVFHDLAGWLMMPLALGMLWVELRLLSWVIITRQVEGDRLAGVYAASGNNTPAPAAKEAASAPNRRSIPAVAGLLGGEPGPTQARGS